MIDPTTPGPGRRSLSIPVSAVCHGQHIVDFPKSIRNFSAVGATELTLFMDWRTAEKSAKAGMAPDAIERACAALDHGLEVTLRLELHGQPLHGSTRPTNGSPLDAEAGFPPDVTQIPVSQLVDTDGEPTAQLNFFNTKLRARISEYLARIEPWMDQLDRSRTHIALAVSEQNEVKYGMRQYKLRAANPEIRAQLDGMTLEQMQHFQTRQKLDARFAPQPGLAAFQALRTEALADFCEFLYRELSDRHFKVSAYFGRFMGPHDFIFGAPIINEANRFADRIVCDHNFFNGDRLVFDREKLSTMTSYIRTSLAVTPAAGIYVEQTHSQRGRNAQISPERIEAVMKCVDYLARHDPPNALEIGGFRDHLDIFPAAIDRFNQAREEASAELPARQVQSVYLLAANETFDYFRNDKDHNHEHRLELAMNFAYSVIADELGWKPYVISTASPALPRALSDPKSLVVLPMQFALGGRVLDLLERAECKVLADIRPGQLTPDGVDRNGAHLERFGITRVLWRDPSTLAHTPLSFVNRYSDPLFNRVAVVRAPGFNFIARSGPQAGVGASSSRFFHLGFPLFLCNKNRARVGALIRGFVSNADFGTRSP